jgi:hypothetical protein
MPCIDSVAVCAVPHQSEVSSGTDNSHDYPTGTDVCSPFCSCQCCQTNIVFLAVAFNSPVAEFPFSYNEYKHVLQNPEISGFYTPPKA